MMQYRLIGPTGHAYLSPTPGALGGNAAGRPQPIYGRLDCASARRALARGSAYRRGRVFFASEHDAIAAGYRPCGACLPAEYAAWKEAQPKWAT